MTLKSELRAIIGAAHVSNDADILAPYSGDLSLEPPCSPAVVVQPSGAEKIQAIVKYAGQNDTP